MANVADYRILVGDALEHLRTLPDQSVHVCITSPPYWGLRDYHVDGQIGREPTPEAYIERLVAVFREVWRVLRPDGTLWLNLGDSYAHDNKWGGTTGGRHASALHGESIGRGKRQTGLKPKDLVGIPWRMAFALQADGWWLRSDIVWCLSGGSIVYVRSQRGDMPMTIKDLARLDPSTVQLWNGKKWTRLRGVSKSRRRGDEITLVLRSGELIACTPTHRFPTERGIIPAGEVTIGDRLQRVVLPEPDEPKDSVHIGTDAAWFAGLYLAEGSMSGDTIQIAGHAKEQARWERVLRIAEDYGGTATRTVEENRMNIRVYGKVLVSLVRQLVAGHTAKDKGIAPVCWRYSNEFLRAYLDGYLSGDGHWDEKNGRWRIAFTRNYNLERDLRVLAARLGLRLTLNLSHAVFDGKQWPTFRGEIRFERSGHHNEACMEEVVRIEKAKARYVYDLGVEDEPHVFALASGILTHNSKPNPMPESVTDRPTRSHEYIFLLAKSERYYYDAQAIREPAVARTTHDATGPGYRAPGQTARRGNRRDKQRGHSRRHAGFNARWDAMTKAEQQAHGRNKRDVWWVATHPYHEAHFATFPETLVEPMILAGCPVGGTVLDPFAGTGTTLAVANRLGRHAIGIELNPAYVPLIHRRCAQMSLVFEEEGSL